MIDREKVINELQRYVENPNLTLCEITMDAYSGNYMRSAINYAIRRACWRWNKDNPESKIY